MTVVVTSTKPTGVRDYNDGPYKCRIRDITFDTGTYVTGGNSITAASIGLKSIDLVVFGTQAMTGGTSGATVNWIGVTYASNRQSVTFQQYECAATGLPGLEKTSAEATVANATFRVEFRSVA
jgi:hypothetical protein